MIPYYVSNSSYVFWLSTKVLAKVLINISKETTAIADNRSMKHVHFHITLTTTLTRPQECKTHCATLKHTHPRPLWCFSPFRFQTEPLFGSVVTMSVRAPTSSLRIPHIQGTQIIWHKRATARLALGQCCLTPRRKPATQQLQIAGSWQYNTTDTIRRRNKWKTSKVMKTHLKSHTLTSGERIPITYSTKQNRSLHASDIKTLFWPSEACLTVNIIM